MKQRQGERHACKLSACCGELDTDWLAAVWTGRKKAPLDERGQVVCSSSLTKETLAVTVAALLAALLPALLATMLAALSGILSWILGLLAGLLAAALLLAGLLLPALLILVRILRILSHSLTP
jgi:hypothetical protein